MAAYTESRDWAIHSPVGAQPILDTSTTQNHPLGTKAVATDPTYGQGEFIYLKGIGSTVIGSLVTFDTTTLVTELSANTAGIGAAYAVAMSANVASQYGWYQVRGLAIIKKTAVAVSPAVALYQSATTSRVMSTVASGKQVVGARSANLTTVVTSTSVITANINMPHNTGVII